MSERTKVTITEAIIVTVVLRFIKPRLKDDECELKFPDIWEDTDLSDDETLQTWKLEAWIAKVKRQYKGKLVDDADLNILDDLPDAIQQLEEDDSDDTLNCEAIESDELRRLLEDITQELYQKIISGDFKNPSAH